MMFRTVVNSKLWLCFTKNSYIIEKLKCKKYETGKELFLT